MPWHKDKALQIFTGEIKIPSLRQKKNWLSVERRDFNEPSP
jgi:hypothetical protein